MTANSQIPADAPKRAEPESFRGRSLQASLTVKNIQTTLAWYCDILGFTVDMKHERDGKLLAVTLKAGTVQILIGQDDGAKGWDRVKGEGFSLQITTAQDVDELAQRIKELGGTLDMEPTSMPWGARVFRVHDPDGFKLAISSERA
jgi:uncharacterized glyoxalase superfamily protein PhnB